MRLAEAGFNLRKFATNSLELRERIRDNEQRLQRGSGSESPSTLQKAEPEESQVLRVRWDIDDDTLIFDVSNISQAMNETLRTKRNAVSLATRFFDPLGVISPLIVRFKVLFQQLCEAKTEWDEPLTGKSLVDWKTLTSDLQQATPMSISRCCVEGEKDLVKSYSLQGFCDASLKAYAAVVYLRVETETGTHPRFLCAKTRVAPLKGFTIPRLELMSALLLAKLVSSIGQALDNEIKLDAPICHTDSQVLDLGQGQGVETIRAEPGHGDPRFGSC